MASVRTDVDGRTDADGRQKHKSAKSAAERDKFLAKVQAYREYWASLDDEQRTLEKVKATRNLLSRHRIELDPQESSLRPEEDESSSPENPEAVTLWDLAVDANLELLNAKAGFGRDTNEEPAAIIANKPGWLLRPGAAKMQLRPGEEKRLSLSLMGRGYQAQFPIVLSIPLMNRLMKPKLEMSYGVFCRAKGILPLLGPEYAQRAPEDVLLSNRYYQDLVNHAAVLEATVMVVLATDMPILDLRRRYLPRIHDQVESGITVEPPRAKEGLPSVTIPPTREDLKELEELDTLFSPDVLEGTDLLTPEGCFRKDTRFFFTATPSGGLAIEAELPGPAEARTSILLRDMRSRHVTYAVLSAFFGPAAIDPVAQFDIGACFLYHANGFELEHEEHHPHRLLMSHKMIRDRDQLMGPKGEILAGVVEDVGDERPAHSGLGSSQAGPHAGGAAEGGNSSSGGATRPQVHAQPASITWARLEVPWSTGVQGAACAPSAGAAATSRPSIGGPVRAHVQAVPQPLQLARDVHGVLRQAGCDLRNWASSLRQRR